MSLPNHHPFEVYIMLFCLCSLASEWLCDVRCVVKELKGKPEDEVLVNLIFARTLESRRHFEMAMGQNLRYIF